jgi:2-(1,2-epoxy-1,2-dihydrophenyl)acetyl-CoA isomerase
VLTELLQALNEAKKDESIRIIELTGEGKGFSSGGDINIMLEQSDKEQFSAIMDTINELVMTLYTMPKLVVTGVHGAVAGLGLSLALASDYIICEETSKLAMNFIGIALIPDGGSHYLLQERLGMVDAKKLIWNGKVLNGQEALMKGLVDEVTPTGKLRESLDRYETISLQKPLQAMLKTKEIFVEMNKGKFKKALELEKEGQWLMRKTEDHQEGIKAFIEKRKPMFTGK